MVEENFLVSTARQVGDSLVRALQHLIGGVPDALVGLAVAVIFIALGWIIGDLFKKIVARVLQAAKLDEWAKEHKLRDAIAGIPLSELAGSFVKLYVILIFLSQATEFVLLGSIRTFLNALIYYIPLIIAGLIILTLGVLLAKFVRNKIEATQHRFKKTAANIVEFIIIYVALVIALRRVGIDVGLLEWAFIVAFTVFVVLIAVVIGVGVGSAFKEDARDFVAELKKDLK